MSYHIIHIPQVKDRTKHSAGNGGNIGSSAHHIPKLDPTTGLRLYHGNGCQYYPDCFTCPFPPDKCRYGNRIHRSK